MQAIAPGEELLLRCSKLRKQFGGLVAVNDVSFAIERGGVLGIGGPNGAGKTTLFDLISGLQKPTSGSVIFDGNEISHAGPEQLCHAGIARTFQLNAGFDTLTVLENVEVASYFGAAPVRIPGLHMSRRARDRALAALDRVGLSAKRHQVVRDLPVIDRKLLMLAGALATEPTLLLMDEPVGGLTPSEIGRFAEIVSRARDGGLSIIVIEHVMRFLLELCDRILILHQGAVLFDGEKHAMLHDEEVVRVYLGDGAARQLEQVVDRGISGNDVA